MCLATNCIIPFIALRDRKVYKVLRTDGSWAENKSPIQSFQYSPNTGYQSSFSFSFLVRQWKKGLRVLGVNEGLHVFRDYATALVDYGAGLSYKVVEMTIPKGAIYFLGANNEIVSNKLVTGNLEAL